MEIDQDLQAEPTIFTSRLTCVLVAILLFIALLYRQNDLALLTLLILLLMASCKIWSRISLAKVSCSIRADKQRLFPGEKFSLTTIIVNAKFLPVWACVTWPGTHMPAGHNDQPEIRQEADLLWYQQAELKQDLVAHKRGCYELGPSDLATSDVFGFFKTAKRHFQPLEIIVYPRIITLKPVSLPKRDLFGTPGSQSPVKDPVYIIGTQDYQPARPARHIHWKASARRLKLQEKIFEPSEQGKIMIGLDVAAFEPDLAANAFESTLEVLASLILQLDRMDLAVGFLTNGALKGASMSLIPTGRGTHQLAAILEILGRLQMRSHTSFKTLIKKTPGMQRGATWVYFSYHQDKNLDEMRTYCRTVNIPCVFFTWDQEASPRKSSSVSLPDIHSIQDLRPPNLEQT
jgi:uncharacterized protein (DUF58 family)